MNSFRLAPGPTLLRVGSWTVVGGVLVIVAVLLAAAGPRFAAVVVALFAAASLVWAARLALRPPVVVTVDEHGLRTRGRPSTAVAWADVTDVRLGGGLLTLERDPGEPVPLALALVRTDDQSRLVREVYDRLNTAHGYTRFDPTT